MPTVPHTRAPIKPTAELKSLAFLPVNRNLRNCPIARGARAKLNWQKRTKRGYRFYRLPGGVEVRLPLDCGLGRRHATGFDVAMLLTLTGLVIARGPAELAISNTAILKHMRVRQGGTNRARVAAALAFWQHATITWPRWYTPNRKVVQLADKYSTVTIERPILEASRGRVVLNRDWVRLHSRVAKFFAQVPTPLPVRAPQLNLLLMIVGHYDPKQLAGGEGSVRYRSVREITKRMGLNSHDRFTEFRYAAERVVKWFKRRGGRLDVYGGKPNVLFEYWLPRIEAPAHVKRKRMVRAKFAKSSPN
jgi:hypothetical protein